MNYQNALQLKENYNTVVKIFENFDESPIAGDFSDVKISKIVGIDIAQFMMYLSAADGRLDENEVRLFNVITGYTDGVSSIRNFIEEHNIYSTEFESTVPISMRVAVEIQYNLMRVMDKVPEMPLPEILFTIFEQIGEELIAADGGVTYTERRDLNIYLDTLRGYMRDKGF